MSGTLRHPAPHPHRPIPGPDPDSLYQPGRPGGPVQQALLLDNLCPHSRGRPPEPQFPLDEPGRARPHHVCVAGPGGCIYLGAAEDDHDPVHRSQATVYPDHDAVDDAPLPGGFLPGLAQRTAPVLDNFQPHRHHHPILHHGLGTPFPAVPQAHSGSGVGPDQPDGLQ